MSTMTKALRAELDRLRAELAAANALLGRWVTMFSHERDLGLRIDSERHLAGQTTEDT